MKKFSFTLEKVLKFKNQILDNLKNEHAQILMEIHKQEDLIDNLRRIYNETCKKYNEEKLKTTLKIENVMQYEHYLEKLNERINAELLILKKLNLKEEKKRAEVVRAKQDSESIEKLKSKKIEAYKKDLQHEQEQILEEFITNKISSV